MTYKELQQFSRRVWAMELKQAMSLNRDQLIKVSTHRGVTTYKYRCTQSDDPTVRTVVARTLSMMEIVPLSGVSSLGVAHITIYHRLVNERQAQAFACAFTSRIGGTNDH